MSILIKGMEMPKSCYVCPFCDELDALAIKTGVSKSEMIREATAEYVKRHTAEEGEA